MSYQFYTISLQLRRNFSFPLSFMVGILVFLVARTTEVGSRTLVHASLWGTKEVVHGKYLNKCQVEEESDYAISSEGKKVQDRLWVSNLLINLSQTLLLTYCNLDELTE
jgi:retinol dehydrogenase 12